MSLTQKDKQDLGDMFEKKLESHKPVFECPNGITPETAQGIKDLVSMMNNGKKTTTRVLITAFWLGLISLVVAGFWSKVSSFFK